MLFLKLLYGTIPLLLLILCGYLIGKKGHITAKAIGDILINVINPFVIFGAIAKLSIESNYIFLPFIGAFFAVSMGGISWFLARKIWQNETANLVAMSCVSGNITYFALPILMLILPAQWVGVYLMLRLGINISDLLWGYYIGARGHFNVRDSIVFVLKIPPIYGMILGFLYHFSGFPLPEIVNTYWQHAMGSLVFIGMMIIGVSLSHRPRFTLDVKMFSFLTLMRFVLWPSLTISLILMDKLFLNLFIPEIHLMIFLVGIVPLPANAIANASYLNFDAQNLSVCVLYSTIIAIFYVPLMLTLATTTGLLPVF